MYVNKPMLVWENEIEKREVKRTREREKKKKNIETNEEMKKKSNISEEKNEQRQKQQHNSLVNWIQVALLNAQLSV